MIAEQILNSVAPGTLEMGDEAQPAPPASGEYRTERQTDRPEIAEFTSSIAPGPLCDDLRQLAVVVWARALFLERLASKQAQADPRLLTGLADIGAAISEISKRLDSVEDRLLRTAA